MRCSFVILLVAGVMACKAKEPSTPAASTTDQTQTTATSAATAPVGNSTETAITSAESPIAPEVNPPGDIPDSQAFVRFKSDANGYEVEVPEGWARTDSGPVVTFVDKLDGVKVAVAPAPAAPTAATARDREAKQIQQSGRAVQITDIKDVKLPGGPAVVIKYTSNSDPNAVTNRQVRLENEAYIFFKNGKEAVLTVWAPKGADNADQWARMSKSFRWQ